jgi:nicotinamide-nucleotide amidase
MLFLEEGLITYTAEEKIRLAKVSKDTIEKYGVVSPEVAIEMAEGGRKVLKVDICVSVTGNAAQLVN